MGGKLYYSYSMSKIPQHYTIGSMGRMTKVQHSHAKPKRMAVPKRLSWANKYWIPSLMGKEHLSKRDSSLHNGQILLRVVK